MENTTNSVKREKDNLGNKISLGVEMGRQCYEGSVMQRMQGRSGAYTASGSKGIVLEIMGNDKINASNVLNPEVTAKLTKQANAPQVDAVIMNGNKVASRLQYKDVLSTSGIRDITNSTKNGKYNAAKLMGTTECAEKFNKAAEKAGINKRMMDTGISSKTTQRIGDKFTGQMPKVDGMGDLLKKSVAVSAGITAGTEIIKSINNGDSVSECARNVTTKVTENVVNATVSTAAAEIVSTVLAPFGPVVSVGGGLITAAVTNEVVSEKTKDFIEDVGFEIEYGLNVLGAQVSCFFGSIFGF